MNHETHQNSPQQTVATQTRSLLPAPKVCNSSLLPCCLCSLAAVPATPFSATLTRHSQLTENPAALSPAFATLTRRVKHKSFVCHSCRKHPGWGMPFSSNLRTIKSAEPAAIFLATSHSPLVTSSVPINLLESTNVLRSATVASKELTPK